MIYLTAITIERRGEYIYLRYSDGVRIKWDNGMGVFITVEDSFMNKVSGLCGDYNLNKTTEYFMPDGLLARNEVQFANSWRIDSSVSD